MNWIVTLNSRYSNNQEIGCTKMHRINYKNFRSFLMIIALSLSCATANPFQDQSKGNKNLELIILHNNDMHGHFEQADKFSGTCKPEDAQANNCFGGFARVSSVVKEFRKAAENDGPAVLYLNAGDTYTGTPWFSIFQDKICSEFMNLLNPDAMCLGNHEFDIGVKGLLPFLDDVNFPVLVANLNISVDHPLWKTRSLRKSHFFEVRGFKIGVIGYITPKTINDLVNERDVTFLPEIDSINKEAELLKEDGVNIIIGLGHSGYDVDQNIAKACPLIDVIVGGHSHTLLQSDRHNQNDNVVGPYPTIVTQHDGKEVPVVQAYAFTKYMGKLKLTFNENGELIQYSGRPILLNSLIKQDPEVLALENYYRPKVIARMEEVLGVTKVFLDGSRCRFIECNIGNMATDALISTRIHQYEGLYMTDASIAFIVSGDIRASIKTGEITRYDLETILPFENQIVGVNITGVIMRHVLEHSVAKYSDAIGRGEFMQMSGVRVVFNMTKNEGNRVVSASVLCTYCKIPSYKELDPDQIYGVLVSSFVFKGGDGYYMFSQNNIEGNYMNGTVTEAVQIYIRHSQILDPKIDGRITLVK